MRNIIFFYKIKVKRNECLFRNNTIELHSNCMKLSLRPNFVGKIAYVKIFHFKFILGISKTAWSFELRKIEVWTRSSNRIISVKTYKGA